MGVRLLAESLIFLKSIKVKNVGEAICIDHDPFYSSISHPYGEYQGVIMI